MLDAESATHAESVNAQHYGAVTNVLDLPVNKIFDFVVPAQSVILLTIPKSRVKKVKVIASNDATVVAGTNTAKPGGEASELKVQLDASKPENNHVAYISFNLAGLSIEKARKILLKVNGYTDKDSAALRVHVYGIPSVKWNQRTLNWQNAPLLDAHESLIKEVGQRAFVAGELSFSKVKQDQILDVTSMMKKRPGKEITFVIIRETRQLGDDEDKGKKVMIGSSESFAKPELIFLQQN